MSLFASMTTAISGMNAQGKALSHISGNVANSQTVGYKRIDTSFEDLLAYSSRSGHLPGSVIARPSATNTVQGDVEQVDNPLAMAVTGNGFFSVARPTGRLPDGTVTFDRRVLVSRAGDFEMNRDGYLVNSVGDVLQGWAVNADGTLNRANLAPIRVPQALNQPVATDMVQLSANLPATPADGEVMQTEAQVYDALGTLRPLRLTWTPPEGDGGQWRLTVTAPNVGGVDQEIGTVDVLFGTNGMATGTISGFANEAGLDGSDFAAGGAANVAFNVDFGSGPQAITLNLGAFGAADGLTQFGGTTYELRSLQPNGAPPGAFSSVAVRNDGAVVVNYDNGQSRTIALVPVVTFPNPDALERLDGQAFALTADAGAMRLGLSGEAGAGRISAGAVERSNVDIAEEFSKLIVAQRAYTANTRVVTAADELLQDTINMRR